MKHTFFQPNTFIYNVAICYIMTDLKLNELGEIDKKILFQLLLNGDQTHQEIANKIKTSRQNVSQRIKKLKQKNFIKSFTIDLNAQEIDELKIKAYIFIREDPNIKDRIKHEKLIEKIPQITSFARLYGRYSGIIEILVKDNEEANTIINQLHSLPGIIETETHFTREILKDDRKAPILAILSI